MAPFGYGEPMGTRSYHHGDLPEATKRAALAEITEHGHAGLRIRAIARLIGVSHAAVFRHFPDREHLLAAIAAEGFGQLTQALSAAHAGAPTAAAALDAGTDVYLAFAIDHPHLYRLMFDGSIEQLSHPALATAAGASFSLLVEALSRMEHPDPHRTAVMAWSTLHGLANLSIDGMLAASSEELAPLAREAIRRIQRSDPTSDR